VAAFLFSAVACWGRRDKCVVGIPTGTYLLPLGAVSGTTPPPGQWVTITRGAIAQAEGICTLAPPQTQGSSRPAPSR
jgi:hypothetical protein